MTFTLLRSSDELVDLSVLQDSVKSVFSSFNWSNQPAALQPVDLNEPLNLKLTVQQCFASIAWDARSIAPPAQPDLPPERKAFTLDDFSDLF